MITKFKLMKRYFFLISFISLPLFSFAQEVKGSGVYLALNQFLNTEFFEEYDAIRERAEESVRLFKITQHQYSEEDVASIMDAYNSSAEYFNLALYNIKDDLLHKEKRKYIISFPEDYSKQIETDLYRAKDYYSRTYQAEIYALTDGQITGSALLLLIPKIINYTTMAVEIIQKIQDYVKKFNEDLLNKYLIDAYKFKSWDEIN